MNTKIFKFYLCLFVCFVAFLCLQKNNFVNQSDDLSFDSSSLSDERHFIAQLEIDDESIDEYENDIEKDLEELQVLDEMQEMDEMLEKAEKHLPDSDYSYEDGEESYNLDH